MEDEIRIYIQVKQSADFEKLFEIGNLSRIGIDKDARSVFEALAKEGNKDFTYYSNIEIAGSDLKDINSEIVDCLGDRAIVFIDHAFDNRRVWFHNIKDSENRMLQCWAVYNEDEVPEITDVENWILSTGIKLNIGMLEYISQFDCDNCNFAKAMLEKIKSKSYYKELKCRMKNSPEECYIYKEYEDGIELLGFKLKELLRYDILIKELVIPNKINGKNIIAIGEKAFSNLELVSVVLPNSVKKIGREAFIASDIGKLRLGDNVEVIEAGAFSENKIKKINFPNTLLELGDEAFSYNELSKVKFPERLEKIGKKTFEQNELKKVYLNQELQEIGDLAFLANSIKKINIPKTLTKIGGGAFNSNCFPEEAAYFYKLNNENEKVFMSYGGISSSPKIDSDVVEIGEYAFYRSAITEFVIPNSVTKIKEYAFDWCSLSKLELSNEIISIGGNAFSKNCLKELVIPDSVTHIGENAFMHNKISRLILSKTINQIESMVFAFNEIGELVIPENITKIKEGAFIGNENIQVDAKNVNIKIAKNAF